MLFFYFGSNLKISASLSVPMKYGYFPRHLASRVNDRAREKKKIIRLNVFFRNVDEHLKSQQQIRLTVLLYGFIFKVGLFCLYS